MSKIIPFKRIFFGETYNDFKFIQDRTSNVWQTVDFSKKIKVSIQSLGLITGKITVPQIANFTPNFFMTITDLQNNVLQQEEFKAKNYNSSDNIKNDFSYFAINQFSKTIIDINKIRKIYGDDVLIYLTVMSGTIPKIVQNDGSLLDNSFTINKNLSIFGTDDNFKIVTQETNGYDTFVLKLPKPTFTDFFYIIMNENNERFGMVDDTLSTFKQFSSLDKRFVDVTDKYYIFDLPKFAKTFDYYERPNTFNLLFKNLWNDIDVEEVDNLTESDSAKMVIPPNIPSIDGQTLALYHKNSVLSFGVPFDTVAIGATVQGDGLMIPTSGTWNNLTFSIYSMNVLNRYRTNIKSISKDSDPVVPTPKIMLLGESTTQASEFRKQLYKLLGEDSRLGAKLVGSFGDGTASDPKHEGYPGWTTDQILSVQSYNGINNAFYNPTTQKFDLNYYFNKTSVEIPDVVYIGFGLNDVLGADNGDKISFINNVITIMKNFRSIKKNIRFIVGMSNLPSEFEQFHGTTSYLPTQNMLQTFERMIAIWGYSDNITLAPLYMSLHRKWHMRYDQQPVVPWSDVKEYYGTNNIHPSDFGYDMTAGMVYNSIRYNLSK